MKRIKIYYDDDAGSPREDDNLGTMACWHRRHRLGDTQPSEEPLDYIEGLPKGTVILDLFLMDHSGLTISTSDSLFRAVDRDQWDWGQIGWIHATPEKIRAWFGVTRISAKTRLHAIETLRAEVELYDEYIRGSCYGFVIEDVEGCESCAQEAVESNSCWGFIGSDIETNGMLDHIPDELHDAAREAMRAPVSP